MNKIDPNIKSIPVNQNFTFADIPDREWALKTSEAVELLQTFPEDKRKLFIDCFLNPENSEKEALLEYLLSSSDMARHIKKFPGSSEMFEYLYLAEKPKSPFDNFFTKCKSGVQINERLISLEKNIPTWINKLYNGKILNIDNFFSGPGRDMINVLRSNPDLVNKVDIRNIDIDKRAIEIGERLVKDLKLDNIFSFVNKPFNEAEPRQADLIILVGVLCPLKLEVSRRILEKMIFYSRQGGYIIYSTAQYKLLFDDPLTDFLMRLVGWGMSYKTDEEAFNLAKESGWEPIGQFFDEPLHHHCMTVAKLK